MRVLCPNRDHIPHLGSVAHTSVPSLYSHHGTQKKKETVSPALWGWGRERTVIMTTQGSSPPGPAWLCCSELGVETHSSSTWEPFHGRSAGDLCFKPHSRHQTIQGAFDPNNILSPPAPGQALGRGPFLSMLTFILSCSNARAACPIRPRWVTAAGAGLPPSMPASHLTRRPSFALVC